MEQIPGTSKSPSDRFPTRCGSCSFEFWIGPSRAMRAGINEGYANCPSCGIFLHVELLEGEAWTEPFLEYSKRIMIDEPETTTTEIPPRRT